MGPSALQEGETKEEMESYHDLLQASSQLENTLQREYIHTVTYRLYGTAP